MFLRLVYFFWKNYWYFFVLDGKTLKLLLCYTMELDECSHVRISCKRRSMHCVFDLAFSCYDMVLRAGAEMSHSVKPTISWMNGGLTRGDACLHGRMLYFKLIFCSLKIIFCKLIFSAELIFSELIFWFGGHCFMVTVIIYNYKYPRHPKFHLLIVFL